jgi:hypothetical protein
MPSRNFKRRTWGLASGMLVATGLLVSAFPGYATEQAQERREGRDIKQDTRKDARKEKVDCRQENNKNNAECRQDKRDTKQDGREKARDVKR